MGKKGFFVPLGDERALRCQRKMLNLLLFGSQEGWIYLRIRLRCIRTLFPGKKTFPFLCSVCSRRGLSISVGSGVIYSDRRQKTGPSSSPFHPFRLPSLGTVSSFLLLERTRGREGYGAPSLGRLCILGKFRFYHKRQTHPDSRRRLRQDT